MHIEAGVFSEHLTASRGPQQAHNSGKGPEDKSGFMVKASAYVVAFCTASCNKM